MNTHNRLTTEQQAATLVALTVSAIVSIIGVASLICWAWPIVARWVA
jgi:hypothetical protein